jgi:predicted CXXCH cytochrome family protein
MMVQRRTRRDWQRRSIVAVILLCTAVGWLGCATPEERYRTLSIFFDGVPNPSPTTQQAAGLALTNAGAGGAAPMLLSTHKPFVEKQCQSCHETAQGGVSTATLTADSCISCHEKTLTQYSKMHEAVTNKACLWCHEPHGSRYVKLLRTDTAMLCIQCHERGTLSTKTVEHTTGEGACLTCHMGHKAWRD